MAAKKTAQKVKLVPPPNSTLLFELLKYSSKILKIHIYKSYSLDRLDENVEKKR
jgi:hypothetical protein